MANNAKWLGYCQNSHCDVYKRIYPAGASWRCSACRAFLSKYGREREPEKIAENKQEQFKEIQERGRNQAKLNRLRKIEE